MTSIRSFAAAVAVLAVATLSTAASAAVFSTDYHSQGVWQAYDADNEVYGMKFRTDDSKDGFWLVVSDGPNPKTHVNEYAILYGDVKSNRISAYTYDGENGPNSYKTGTFLGTFDGVFQDGGTHQRYGYDMTMFSIDVAGINGAFDTPDWDGVQLGEQAGIWYHRSEGSNFVYGADGQLLSYSFSDQMWVDDGYKATSIRKPRVCGGEGGGVAYLQSCGATAMNAPNGGGSVPTPGGWAFIGVAMIGLGLHSRRRRLSKSKPLA